MIEFLIILTIIIFGTLLFIIFNLNNQVKQLEEEVQKFDQKEKYLYEELEKYYNVFLGIFSDAVITLERIDKRGSFSSDDEVGFTFRIIKNVIQEVKTKLDNLRKTEEE